MTGANIIFFFVHQSTKVKKMHKYHIMIKFSAEGRRLQLTTFGSWHSGPRGEGRDTRHSGSNFFHFHAVFGNIGQDDSLASPPLQLAPPSSGKSWIRHCGRGEEPIYRYMFVKHVFECSMW